MSKQKRKVEIDSQGEASIKKSRPALSEVEDICDLEKPTKRMKEDAAVKVEKKMESRSNAKVKDKVQVEVAKGESGKSLSKIKAPLKRAMSMKAIRSRSTEDVMPTSIKDVNRFCKAVLESGDYERNSKVSLVDFFKRCSEEKLPEELNVDAIQNSFSRYLSWACTHKAFSLDTIARMLLDYTTDPKALLDHPSYPKEGTSNYAYFLFCQKKGYTSFSSKVPENIRNEYRNESDPLSIECREEARLKKMKYTEDLEGFLNEFGDSLLDEQVEFVNQQIQKTKEATSKAINGSRNSDVPRDKPRNYAYILFRKEKRVKGKMPDEAKQQFYNESDPLTIKCREKAKQKKLEFIKDMKQYLEEHSDSLTDKEMQRYQAQVDRAKDQLAKNESTNCGETLNETPRRSSPRLLSKEQVKKQTAFDFYKLDKVEKYTHLDGDAREEKLKRHFERLSDEKRAMYEEKERNQ